MKIRFLKGPDAGKVFEQPDKIAEGAIKVGVAELYTELEVKEEKFEPETKELKVDQETKKHRGRPKRK